MVRTVELQPGDDRLLTPTPISPTMAALGVLRHSEAGAAYSSQSGVKLMLRRINRAMNPKVVALGVAAVAFGALLTMPALAASPTASSATPQVPCCGGGGGGYPNATVHASASSYDVNYALIASTSSGWHSGTDVYMYYQIEYPDGAYTSNAYPLRSAVREELGPGRLPLPESRRRLGLVRSA